MRSLQCIRGAPTLTNSYINATACLQSTLREQFVANDKLTSEQRHRLHLVIGKIDYGMGNSNPEISAAVYRHNKGMCSDESVVPLRNIEVRVSCGDCLPVELLLFLQRPAVSQPHQYAIMRMFVFADTDGLDESAQHALRFAARDALARLCEQYGVKMVRHRLLRCLFTFAVLPHD